MLNSGTRLAEAQRLALPWVPPLDRFAVGPPSRKGRGVSMQNQALRPLSALRATDKTDKNFDPSVDKLIPSSSGQPTSSSPDPAAIYKRRAARQGQQQPMGKASKR